MLSVSVACARNSFNRCELCKLAYAHLADVLCLSPGGGGGVACAPCVCLPLFAVLLLFPSLFFFLDEYSFLCSTLVCAGTSLRPPPFRVGVGGGVCGDPWTSCDPFGPRHRRPARCRLSSLWQHRGICVLSIRGFMALPTAPRDFADPAAHCGRSRSFCRSRCSSDMGRRQQRAMGSHLCDSGAAHAAWPCFAAGRRCCAPCDLGRGRRARAQRQRSDWPIERPA